MHDRRRRAEVEGLHLLGDLADDVVVSLGRVARAEPLSEQDRNVLGRARELFDLMTSHDVIVVGTCVGRMLGDERTYLDALRVVEREASGGTIEEYVKRVVGVLETALDEDTDQETRRQLETDVARLRQFFVGMSENSLVRTDELSRPGQEAPWRSMRQPNLTS